jgi:LysR family transcriptional regulator, nitrogen assimilation regulatory protein
MEYRDLLAFLTVAKLESFSRAADKLSLAQSALSRRVQRLERHLGAPLLERHARGVRVTEAGALLAAKGEKLDGELRRIEQEIRAHVHPQPREVRMAMPQGAAKLFATAVATGYHSLFPQVRLHLFERESAHNRESVLRGDVDLALVYDLQASEELSVTPLLMECVLIVARAGGALARSLDGPCGVTELARLPLILPGLPHGYRRIVENIMTRHGLTPNIILEVNGFATSLHMVQQGLGFTISTYPPVQSAIEAGILVGMPISSPSCEVELSLVHRADRALPPALQGLKEVIENVSAKVGSTAYWRPAH